MCVGAKRSICGFMGIPPQVAAIETSGRYFAKSSRFLKICCPNSLVGTKTSACIEDELVSINVKEAIKSSCFSCASFGKPNQVSCFAKSSGIAEFLWVQQFSTQKLLLELALKS
jgi:hypothetical protein